MRRPSIVIASLTALVLLPVVARSVPQRHQAFPSIAVSEYPRVPPR